MKSFHSHRHKLVLLIYIELGTAVFSALIFFIGKLHIPDHQLHKI
jgi:hypothetical protein